MAEPLDAIFAIHNAFRRDLHGIDAQALAAARGKPDSILTFERFQFFNDVLSWHAQGEEIAIFPALEAVVPSVAEAYARDHRGLEEAYDVLSGAVSAGDILETARATAAFRFHHDLHLDKEEAHFYRLMKERVPIPEQARAVSLMAGSVPQERFPEVVAWMFPLLGDDDREKMTRIWQMVMPTQVFEGIKALIQKAIGDDWAELTRRIPTLS